MIISKKQLKNHVCEKNSWQEYKQHILFDRTGAISTDGKRVLIVPYPTKAPDELTKDTIVSEAMQSPMDVSVLVHERDANFIADAIAKRERRYRSINDKDHAALVSKPEPGGFEVLFDEDENIKSIAIDRKYGMSDQFPIDLIYKNFDRHPGRVKVRFTTQLLFDLLQKIKNASGLNYVDMYIDEQQDEPAPKPILLVACGGMNDTAASNEIKDNVRAIIMPCIQ